MTTLPITNSTLIHGASDASKGCNVHTDDEEVNSKMKKLAKTLNLKEHIVGGKEIYLPVDLEAHRGLDGKVYLLDFSRLFPPVQPDSTSSSSYLVQLFRP